MLLVDFKNESENIKGLQGHEEDMEIYAGILAAEKMHENSPKVFNPQKNIFPWYLKDFASDFPDEIHQAHQHSILNRTGLLYSSKQFYLKYSMDRAQPCLPVCIWLMILNVL